MSDVDLTIVIHPDLLIDHQKILEWAMKAILNFGEPGRYKFKSNNLMQMTSGWILEVVDVVEGYTEVDILVNRTVEI